MLPPEMKKLKRVENEKTRLERVVADLTLDHEMVNGVHALLPGSSASLI